MCCVIEGTGIISQPTYIELEILEKIRKVVGYSTQVPALNLAQVVCVLSCAHSLLHLCSPIVTDPFPKAEHAAWCQKNISG